MSDSLYLGIVAALVAFCALGVLVLLMWGVVSVCDALRAARNRNRRVGSILPPYFLEALK